MDQTGKSLATLLERVIANGYIQEVHWAEASKRVNAKYVKKTPRNHDIVLGRYEK